MKHLIIIGGMKCGTTSLYKFLAAHPLICPCSEKEPEFFCTNQDHGSYSTLWEFDEQVHDWALEASTGYTKFDEFIDVPKRMHMEGISPKFMYLVRDPIERIESQVRHDIRDGNPNPEEITEQHLNKSRYHFQLMQYLPYFSLDDFIVLDSKLLHNEPSDELWDWLESIGIDISEIEINMPQENTKEHVEFNLPENEKSRIRGMLKEDIDQFTLLSEKNGWGIDTSTWV